MTNPTKLLPTDLIAVEVPKDAEYKISGANFFCTKKDIRGFYPLFHLEGKHQILGEVTEDEISFDVENYVEELTFFEMDENKNVKHFKDYNPLKKLLHDIYCLKTTKESLYSLLRANELYFVNPIEKPKCDCYTEYDREGCPDECWKWINSENKVIKGKLVILKPI